MAVLRTGYTDFEPCTGVGWLLFYILENLGSYQDGCQFVTVDWTGWVVRTMLAVQVAKLQHWWRHSLTVAQCGANSMCKKLKIGQICLSLLQFTQKGGGGGAPIEVCGFRLGAALCPQLRVCITGGRDGNWWNDGRSRGWQGLSQPLVLV